MRKLLICLILVSPMMVNAAKRKPATVSEFERIENKKVTAQDNVISYKITIEKYYALFNPSLPGILKYYPKLYLYLPTHLKAMVEARQTIALQILKEQKSEKLNDYKAAQQVLAIAREKSAVGTPADYDYVALVLVESYFKKEIAPIEDAWIFRMNLYRRLYPEHEYAVIEKYLMAFPKGQMARAKAQYLKDYLISDYRPISGDQDLPQFDVDKLMDKIQAILK